jgi:uncharacterized protein (DUF1810 family)
VAEESLNRFIIAQAETNGFDLAYNELLKGKKQGHWMWYIFPQYKGLGKSHQSNFYAIKSISEAKAYLSHIVLGNRLRLLVGVLNDLEEKNSMLIFGSPDNVKLKSCLTLFSLIDDSEDLIFSKCLDLFYDGKKDQRTLELILND